MLGRHIEIFSADSENGHFTYTDNARVFAVHKDSGEILVKIFLWQRLRIRANQPHRLWINLGDKIGGVAHQKLSSDNNAMHVRTGKVRLTSGCESRLGKR
jgi:hypothetical protein